MIFVCYRDDVLGAQAAGLQGALVRTGKYRPEDEHRKGSLGIIKKNSVAEPDPSDPYVFGLPGSGSVS
jgi:ribonucleotide monophosphatase NagD (HAD superfamily)